MLYAVIIPACDEEGCIVSVLEELQQVLPAEHYVVAVGVNGSTDRTADRARAVGALVAETPQRGYGHGCQAAIELIDGKIGDVAGYIFVAADGANHPADIPRLIEAFERGTPIVLGTRTRTFANLGAMGLRYVAANRLLGIIAGVLAGEYFADLGPLRFIERETFRRLQLCEWTYGWTVEAQVVAGRLGIAQLEIPVRERRRIAGIQKVSRVSWRRTLAVGVAITAAAFRARQRADRLKKRALAAADLVVPAGVSPSIPPAR